MTIIVEISSVVIALCALGIAIWQGQQTRKHNKLSFRPHLTTWTDRNAEKGFYKVELMNNGLGPAVIDEFNVKVDGKLISGSGTEPIEKALKIVFLNLPYQAHHSYLNKGYAMGAKEKCSLAVVQFLSPQLPSWEFVEHTGNRIDIEIKYKSFYGENFFLSTAEAKPAL